MPSINLLDPSLGIQTIMDGTTGALFFCYFYFPAW